MKRILYITHVAWGWIKQRPQFIAEDLSKSFEVDYYYTKSNRFRKANVDFSSNNLIVRGFRFFPFERIPLVPLEWLDVINKFLFWHCKVDFSKYDFIWITEPRLFFLIKNQIKGKRLIYDCMDDMLEFPYIKKYPKLYKFEFDSEKSLLNNAEIVICSAQVLKEKIEKRYGLHRVITVINNAISNDISTYCKEEYDIPQNSLVYIGTISEWLDFKSLFYALEQHSNLKVLLFGPIRMQNPPQHERLYYMGAIPHSSILSVMNKAMGLVMPFIVNELIESVNPVKLYEYIYSGKPICASRYGESEKFSDYIFLYSGEKEFDSFVVKVLQNSIQTNMQLMREFALCNTWRSRSEQIVGLLNN